MYVVYDYDICTVFIIISDLINHKFFTKPLNCLIDVLQKFM